jgi:hypothetical protein
MSRRGVTKKRKVQEDSLVSLAGQAPELQTLPYEVPPHQAHEAKRRQKKVILEDLVEGGTQGEGTAAEPIANLDSPERPSVEPVHSLESGEFQKSPEKSTEKEPAGPSQSSPVPWLEKTFFGPDPADIEACRELGSKICNVPRLKRLGTLENQIPFVGSSMLNRVLNNDSLKKIKKSGYNVLTLTDHLGYSFGEVSFLE